MAVETVAAIARLEKDRPRSGWDDNSIPDHGNEVSWERFPEPTTDREKLDLLEPLVAALAQVVWVACDEESEEATNVDIGLMLGELANRLDVAGVKWTSGR